MYILVIGILFLLWFIVAGILCALSAWVAGDGHPITFLLIVFFITIWTYYVYKTYFLISMAL
jgi:hypothetical protein